ncbi:hypothetical protein TrVE_jg8314 [Triparma verrucosa]|uniref:Uncharacterized protein n=1 Tax=Triparma verrucosa TaxID=1606542 RepID=A0A9W7F6L9_9STRA|nr:hypothetical protein TrVE_jg8314 [Triparma verrucosa]
MDGFKDALALILPYCPSLRQQVLPVLALSLGNFAYHSSLFDLLIVSKLRYKFPSLFGKPKWISNITGTPTAVDDVTTAMIGPFPELNDFNAITAMVPLPVTLTGLPPDARYWSIQAFLKDGGEMVAGDQIVCDQEFELDSNGKYTLTIGPEEPSTGSWINSGKAKVAKMIVIRAFMVPGGKGWRAPVLSRNNTPVPMAETDRIAGRVALWRAETSGPMHRLKKLITINGSMLFAFPSSSRLFLSGVIGSLLIRNHLLKKVSKKMRGMLLGVRKLKPNVDVSRPAARASLGGSAKHAYFTMIYDARDHDVVVGGVHKYVVKGKEQFRYTSTTVYEFTSLPISGYFDDTSLVNITKGKRGKDMFEVVLTTSPKYEKGLNEIDVSSQPVGVCVVRLVYPEEDETLEECKPTIKAVEKVKRD